MYLLHGVLHADHDLDTALALLRERLADTLADPLDSETVLACAERFAEALQEGAPSALPDTAARAELAAFCRRPALQAKLSRELGEQPGSLRRPDYREPRFEAWRPLGVVLHVTPANAALLPFMAVLEGLLAGNINWLRPSSRTDDLSARLLAELLRHDASGRLAAHIAVLPVPSARLGALLACADGVSAWGGATALAALRAQLPPGCRWIDWGHRISFAYLAPDALSDAQLDALADDVCRHDQQACSSPQAVLVDSDDPATLDTLARRLAAALRRRAPHWPALRADRQEAAEISTRMAFHRLDQAFADAPGEVIDGDGWRIAWTLREELTPSPLFRTVELRPAPRARLAGILRPWRTHLQSCGLVAAARVPELSRLLLAAGVSRITPVGRMHDGYAGEPHDGAYALQRLSRRVSVSLDPATLPGHAHLDAPPAMPEGLHASPVMDKAAFQHQPDHARAQLYFRSGGSSGTPKLARFSYRDYHRQMRAAADGLFAAGLDPATDRVMNLLYGGNLYGGMLSFFTILEALGVPQYPMGGPVDDDFSEIARLIVEQRIDTLIGMPGTVHRLFERESDALRRYGGVRKVFCGGEHVNAGQRTYLASFGVELIRSAIYGSVDAGPLGHACASCADGEFHLLADTQWLEVLEPARDVPAAPGETGRLVFTSRHREAQRVLRYDLGDLGRWLPGVCPCGLETPRFRLAGRHGALLRVGTIFVDPEQLSRPIGQPMQWLIDRDDGGRDRIRLLVDGDPASIRARVLDDAMLNQVVSGGLLRLEVSAVAAAAFQRHPHSGKTPFVMDLRG
ncbi:long-chain-fatty-acyl-CoA reductase [Burkholderia sp. MSMB617WGS]|uniref:long-chain-fatty-acyl-CoA reductase n=1 Tax=Burkholderia savannae TaxID=1637837 RepID=A0ABR5T794_9BURK|nr:MULTISPECIES: acyl-CoA reductase [Burkholderia]AOK50849.1 long-chain-fatty-acyl-CoA reductase [Burkholderia sp. MSMB617WGS]KGR93043.1 acyl-CoA reductase family protein [Burkholderia sp. ABCPW 111]KWZ39074.1 long-chain-fatty-acyl-CoA reductase [Burkholderia savannae]